MSFAFVVLTKHHHNSRQDTRQTIIHSELSFYHTRYLLNHHHPKPFQISHLLHFYHTLLTVTIIDRYLLYFPSIRLSCSLLHHTLVHKNKITKSCSLYCLSACNCTSTCTLTLKNAFYTRFTITNTNSHLTSSHLPIHIYQFTFTNQIHFHLFHLFHLKLIPLPHHYC